MRSPVYSMSRVRFGMSRIAKAPLPWMPDLRIS
jgi:hypothetical protein